MNAIIFLCAFWCFMWYVYHTFRTREPPNHEPPEPDNILHLLEVSDKLHELTKKYRQIDTMLTDVTLIAGNSEKGIAVSVPSLTGKSTEYNFICSQADTEDFTKALQAERQRLKAEIFKVTDSISDRQGRA